MELARQIAQMALRITYPLKKRLEWKLLSPFCDFILRPILFEVIYFQSLLIKKLLRLKYRCLLLHFIGAFELTVEIFFLFEAVFYSAYNFIVKLDLMK